VLVAMSACAVDTGEEDVASDGEEIVSSRCAGTQGTTSITLKVMTINLRHDDDDPGRRFPLIADEIVRLDPDVIGLQEIEIGTPFFGAHQADKLNDLIAKRGHAKYHLYQRHKPGVHGYLTGEGIGIMSRWTIAEEHHEDLPESRTSLLARIKHPSGKEFDAINTHLHSVGGAEGDAIRVEQSKQIIDLADRNDKCLPTVFTGDMNSTDTSQTYANYVAAEFVDSYKKIHGADTPKIGNTNPVVLAEGAFEQHPKHRIDFIFGRSAGGKKVTPTSSEVVFKNHDAKGFYPSDHFGVITTFTVRL